MVEEAIAGGAAMIQLREKELQGTRLKEEACRVQAVCRKSGIPFIINDNVELAIKIGADGGVGRRRFPLYLAHDVTDVDDQYWGFSS